MGDLNLLQQILFYIFKIVLTGGCAILGVFLGKFLRAKKDAKNVN